MKQPKKNTIFFGKISYFLLLKQVTETGEL
jgi:hypothetical protein